MTCARQSSRVRAFPARVRAAVALVLTVAAATALPATVQAATSVTITANVASHIALTNNCTQQAAWDFGVVIPGSSALTATNASVCSFQFQSNNDTAMVRAYQKDALGTAMGRASTSYTERATAVTDLGSAAAVPGTATTAWIGGWGGFVQKTTDGGATWTTQATGTGGYITSISAVDASTAWMGANSTVRRITSTSGGWVAPAVAAPTGGNTVNELAAADANTVYVAANNGYLLKTTDAGASWTAFGAANGVGSASSNDWMAVDTASATVAYAMDNSTGIYKTANGGTSWTLQTISGGIPGVVTDVSAVDGTNVAWAVDSEGNVFRTLDAGATAWTRVTIATSRRTTAISAQSGTSAYVSAEDGVVYRTTDGTTFTATNMGTANTVKDISVVGTTGYAVGAGMLIETTTTGSSWTIRGTPTDTMFGVWALNADNAWAVGGNGTVRRTTNGGTTWTTTTPTAAHLYSVSFAEGTGWAVGAGGTILKTTDGTAWTAQVSGTGQDLYDVSAVDPLTAFAAGAGGTVLKTTDGGASWTSVSTGTSTWLSISAVDATTVYVSGQTAAWVGGIRKSTDGGSTWSADMSTSYGPVSAIDAVTANVVFATTRWGYVARTTDGGGTWSNTAVSWDFSALDAVTATIAHAAYTYLFRTENGTTWTSPNSPYQQIKAIAAVDENVAIAVGESMSVWRTTTADPVSDYTAGAWAGAGSTNMFGACLQAVSAQTTAAWTVDGNGACTTADTDPWRAVPATASKIGNTTAAGAIGRVDLVFGFRSATTQAPGAYRAPLVFEAIAPNV